MESLSFLLQLQRQAECFLSVALSEVTRTLIVHYVEITRIHIRLEFHLVHLVSPHEHAVHIVDIIIVSAKLRNSHGTIFVVAFAFIASEFVEFHQIIAFLGITEIHIGEVFERPEA